jgi:hypothetical protein
MEFDDLFESNRRNRGNYREQQYHDDNRYSPESHNSNQGYDNHLNWSGILEKIRRNRKLKILVVIAGILILAIAVVLIIILLPVLTKLYDYISQNGLQGILDGITGFLDKIGGGSAK